tara:strand:+ start:10386 stop:11375 length:990 start_codon:yes stop_codon:yes gene_type:complete
MATDPQTQALLDMVNAEGNPQLFELSVADARAALKQITLQLDVEFCEVKERRELMIPGADGEIPVRIYWPEIKTEGAYDMVKNGKLPILLLYHGGGYALGDLDTHENISRYYCSQAQVIVINVGYRLSPEHKFPAGLEDCYAALCWAAANAEQLNGDQNRIAVTGDSAGGNFSAVVCQQAMLRQGPKPVFQLLAYPSLNMDLSPPSNALYPSRQEFGRGGFFLSQNDLEWLSNMYFENPQEECRSPLCSPALTENLSGLPAALIITAGHDPLRDEGKIYADRLAAAGVPVEYHCFESSIHGFMAFSGALDIAKDALELAVRSLRLNLHA